MKVARRKTLIVSILVLSIGLVLSLLYMYPVEEGRTYELTPATTRVYQYDISRIFNASEGLELTLPPPDPPFVAPLIFNVSVFAPPPYTTEVVVFDVKFVGDIENVLWNYTVVRDTGGLDSASAYAENGILGGITTHSGNYSVSISKDADLLYKKNGEPSAPSTISLHCWITEELTEYPYRYLLPFGLASIVVGICFSLWAVAAKQNVPARRGIRPKGLLKRVHIKNYSVLTHRYC